MRPSTHSAGRTKTGASRPKSLLPARACLSLRPPDARRWRSPSADLPSRPWTPISRKLNTAANGSAANRFGPARSISLLAQGRRLLPSAGLTYARLRQFLQLSDPGAQARCWRERLHTHRWRAVLACALSPLILRSVYAAPLLCALPPRFPDVLHARLERLWASHANSDNPYAWRLWLGRACPLAPPPRGDPRNVEFHHADPVEFLENCLARSFDAFSLSNIADGASPTYCERLWRAVRRAATPDARVITRSIGLPRTPDEDHRAARDRAGIWGSVAVTCGNVP